jgi:RNA polymerase sigma-70 factor, ECF subfamily
MSAHVQSGCRRPDEATFCDLYQREVGFLWNALRMLGVPRADLEDATHEVFLALHQGWSRYDEGRPLRPWLYGIAFRVASDRRRVAHRRWEVCADVPETADDAPGPDSAAARSQRRERVLAALDAVEPARRAVLVMHDVEGHAAPDIAHALSIPVNTVYSRLRLARSEFRRAIKRAELAGSSS